MKKNIWILNHYATNMYFDEGGRHYWFAQKLLKKGYAPIIFCSSINHFSDKHVEMRANCKYVEDTNKEVPFVFIKTTKYEGNGLSRIKNMYSFYKNLLSVMKDYSKRNGTPDVIIASSVHPLTLVAGIKIAKKFNIPYISEIRDLWPESLVAYGELKSNSLITKLLYQGEKWIYKQSDAIIMTWEGGFQYIIDRGWQKKIDLSKVYHISNGIMSDQFNQNIKKNQLVDKDLTDLSYKNILYTGSIRKVNNVGVLLDTAKFIKDSRVRFLIYGDGNERKYLEKRCLDEEITNVIFKGRVDKKEVPYLLSNSYANILHNSSTSLDKYGQSQNKFFEYLAAGRPIIQTYTTGYSLLEKYNCGKSSKKQTPEGIAEIILEIVKDEELAKIMGTNSQEVSLKFDFNELTNNLIEVIESI